MCLRPLANGLSAQLSLSADFARDAGYFGGEHGELLNHPIYQFGRVQELAFQPATVDFKRHHLPKIPFGNRSDCACDLRGGSGEVVHKRVESFDFVGPAPNETTRCHALSKTTLFSNHPGNVRGLPCAAFTHRHHFIEGIGDFSLHPRQSYGQPGGKVPATEGQHRLQQVHLKVAIAAISSAGVVPRCEPGGPFGGRPGVGGWGFAHG